MRDSKIKETETRIEGEIAMIRGKYALSVNC